MRYSGKQVVHPGVRARDLPALMELYELNYIQLRRLVPDLDAVQDRSVSKVNGALDLYLTVRERSRYTTTLNLSYRFIEADDSYLAPDVVVRMYHDAQLNYIQSMGGEFPALVHSVEVRDNRLIGFIGPSEILVSPAFTTSIWT